MYLYKYCVLMPEFEKLRNIIPFMKLPSNKINIIKDDENSYTYADCLREKCYQPIPLLLFAIVFVIVLLCIFRGSVVKWYGE